MHRKHRQDEVVQAKIGSAKIAQIFTYEYYMLRAIFDLARSLTIQTTMKQAICGQYVQMKEKRCS